MLKFKIGQIPPTGSDREELQIAHKGYEMSRRSDLAVLDKITSQDQLKKRFDVGLISASRDLNYVDFLTLTLLKRSTSTLLITPNTRPDLRPDLRPDR